MAEDPRRLSIAIVTVANLPEGTGRTSRLRTLTMALVGLGHRVVIWNEHSLEARPGQQVSGEFGGAHFEYVLGTTERKWGFGATKLKLQAVARILAKIRERAAAGELDVLVLNQLAFYDTYPITRTAQRLGIPTIQCFEDERREVVGKVGFAQRIFGLNSWLGDKRCSSMADQMWVISSYLQEKYARCSGRPERVRIIPTIIDCASWPYVPEQPNRPPLLLYSGGFAEQEDFETLAQALGWLRRQKVAFRMRFLGADPASERVRSLRQLIRLLGLEESVEFKGFCPMEELKREVVNANVLLNLRVNSLWSRSGLSTKLSEYLAAGRTVLTSNIGDNARYVEDGKSALVVEMDWPPEKVAQILKRAIEDPELRKRLGAGARQAALRHFDVPVVQNLLAQSIADALRNKNKQPEVACP